MAMAKSAANARPGARDVWRMEDKVAKTDGAAGNCSLSFFALSFLQEVR
jgi:hypothetical protein